MRNRTLSSRCGVSREARCGADFLAVRDLSRRKIFAAVINCGKTNIIKGVPLSFLYGVTLRFAPCIAESRSEVKAEMYEIKNIREFFVLPLTNTPVRYIMIIPYRGIKGGCCGV